MKNQTFQKCQVCLIKLHSAAVESLGLLNIYLPLAKHKNVRRKLKVFEVQIQLQKTHSTIP